MTIPGSKENWEIPLFSLSRRSRTPNFIKKNIWQCGRPVASISSKQTCQQEQKQYSLFCWQVFFTDINSTSVHNIISCFDESIYFGGPRFLKKFWFSQLFISLGNRIFWNFRVIFQPPVLHSHEVSAFCDAQFIYPGRKARPYFLGSSLYYYLMSAKDPEWVIVTL